jgi:ribosomal protein S27E
MKSNKEKAAVKPVGPAKSMEELAGLVFDVPCANCGETVFTLPYVAEASHFVHCHKCGKGTWVGIDEEGSLAHMPEEEFQRRINSLKKHVGGTGYRFYCSCSEYEVRAKLTSFTLKGTYLNFKLECSSCGRGLGSERTSLLILPGEE